MSGALVVIEHMPLIDRRHHQAGQEFIPDRRRVPPIALPDKNAETSRPGWIVIQNNAVTYGSDARVKSDLPPGLIVDTYA
jgi:hypothetical protein